MTSVYIPIVIHDVDLHPNRLMIITRKLLLAGFIHSYQTHIAPLQVGLLRSAPNPSAAE